MKRPVKYFEDLQVGMYYIHSDKTTGQETIILYKGETEYAKHEVSFIDSNGVTRRSFLVPGDIILAEDNQTEG